MSAATSTYPTVQANGLRFAYIEEGAGPLVLLIHGFPDTAHTWDLVRPAVAGAGYRAVSPFTRGYAPTEIPPKGPWDGDTLGRDILGIIEALGETRAIVVGHDWGASGAYSAANQGPDKVELLITSAIPHPGALTPSLKLLWAARHFLALRRKGAAAKLRATDFAYIDELVQRWSPTWRVPAGETDRVKAAFREPGCVEAAIAYYAALGATPPPFTRKRVKVPTVSIAGMDDMIAPEVFDRASSWYTAGYRVARMPGGHFAHREHPEQFNAILLDALARKG